MDQDCPGRLEDQGPGANPKAPQEVRKSPSRSILLIGFGLAVLAGVLFLFPGRRWYPDLSEESGYIAKIFFVLGGVGLLGLGLGYVFGKRMEDPCFKDCCALVGSIVAIVGGTTFLLMPGIVGASGDSGYVDLTSRYGVLFILAGAFGLVSTLVLRMQRRTRERLDSERRDKDL
jgi:hypothetical protein